MSYGSQQAPAQPPGSNVKTYRHVTDTKLERIRFSQTKVGDKIRIIDEGHPQDHRDGMWVFTVHGPPQFSVALLRWKLICDDKHEHKPVSQSLFDLADANVSEFVRRCD